MVCLLIIFVGLYKEKSSGLREIGGCIFVSSSFLILSIYILNLSSLKSYFDEDELRWLGVFIDYEKSYFFWINIGLLFLS
jgi:hypothetical protein